jgi:putative FmdB family regulatory protein
MPVYEYKCDKGHSFEVIQSMADDPLTECEECGAPAQRVLFAPAVHFKGKGFYNTDYGTKKRQRELKSSGDGAAKSDGGSKESGDSGSGASSGSAEPSGSGKSGSSGDKAAAKDKSAKSD